MKENNDGFVRADQIDLKSLDEQLERHLNKVWTMDNKNKKRDEEGFDTNDLPLSTTISSAKPSVLAPLKQRQDWEIDPSKLLIKSVLARGTFGTVHRGVYDGQDVAVKLLDWGEEGHRTDAELASLRAAFTQEVAVWHKLHHPNVTKVTIYLCELLSFRYLNALKKLGRFNVMLIKALSKKGTYVQLPSLADMIEFLQQHPFYLQIEDF